jgi:hypothetical protein
MSRLKVVTMNPYDDLESRLVATVTGPAPRDVASLIDGASVLFYCMLGIPRAYMQIPVHGAPIQMVRGIYHTYKYAARGSRTDFESALCAAIWTDLTNFYKAMQQKFGGPEQHPLFWRQLPHIEEYDIPAAGYDANGSPVEGPTQKVVAIRMRVWVPGLWSTEPQSPYPAEPVYVG